MANAAVATDVSCTVHIHSTYSDGNATIPEILAAARESGRRAVLLTDHDTLGARRDGWEGWHDGVLMLVGHEVSTDRGHMLAFGLEQEVDHAGLSEEAITERIRAGGGVAIAAHPFSEGSRISELIAPPRPWRTLEDESLDGVELWSLLTDEAERWRGPRQILRFFRDPGASMIDLPPEHLRAWDRLCERRRTVAIAGLDAHQRGIRLGRRLLSPLRYRRLFPLLGTHVLCERPLSGDVAADASLLYEAVREGRCYLSVDTLADASGFSFVGEGPNGSVTMGAETTAPELELVASLPRPAEILLLRDGEVVANGEGSELRARASERGSYRVEAMLRAGGRRRIWIVSNPIYLR